MAGLLYAEAVKASYQKGVYTGAAHAERRWHERVERAVGRRMDELYDRLGDAVLEPMDDENGNTRAWREILEDDVRESIKLSEIE